MSLYLWCALLASVWISVDVFAVAHSRLSKIRGWEDLLAFLIAVIITKAVPFVCIWVLYWGAR